MNSERRGASSSICSLGLELQLLLGSQLLARRDHDHIAGLAHGQPLGLEDDVQGLIPRHVLQTQGNVAGNRIACHQIESGEVREQLQDRAHLDVLEVEREAVAGIDDLILLHLLLFGRCQGAKFQSEEIVGLIGQVVVIAPCLNIERHIAALRFGLDGHHRGGEVRDVESPEQALGKRGIVKVDQYMASLLAHRNPGFRAWELDDDTPFPSRTAAEIDVAHCAPSTATAGLARPRWGTRRGVDRRSSARRAGRRGWRQSDRRGSRVCLGR